MSAPHTVAQIGGEYYHSAISALSDLEDQLWRLVEDGAAEVRYSQVLRDIRALSDCRRRIRHLHAEGY